MFKKMPVTKEKALFQPVIVIKHPEDVPECGAEAGPVKDRAALVSVLSVEKPLFIGRVYRVWRKNVPPAAHL
ncbi:MAG: hypothetical protein A2161_14160 [Candidatus Schekmanbacteria bacterium RBG_13_48_7]|uniref:Uncharacterized protein n=1 Tax=Candidatus Schekmanbacteria bacterium RBG_13_48_7 TaxID=1817878 RepID=A0A1F7S1M9_9BACT|nr:MAG: hypothetical protein A2161_14160 [Candidatus Schekmanbacteria bacterium RBG_13_48_7]